MMIERCGASREAPKLIRPGCEVWQAQPYTGAAHGPSGLHDAAQAGQDDDMAAGQRRLDIEEAGDVTIARFVDKKILDENNIQVIGNQLYGLVEEDGRRKIVLDFTNVEYLSSAALGKLITLNNKVKSAKGKLRLCGIRPDIYEVFAITKLNTVFDIRDDRDQALTGL
jgi:anti-sigma B factor antagonist